MNGLRQTVRERLSRHALAYALAGLCLLVAVLYLNTLDNDFVLDDNFYIVDNYLLRDLDNLGQFIDVPADALVEDLEAGFLRGRNVRWLTYAVDYALGGGEAFAFHLSNLLWHAAATCLLFLLAQRLWRQAGAAFGVAVLFAAHPIQTAAVSYISGRKDLLAAFFVLLAFLLVERARDGGRWRYLFAAALAFVLGYFSKEAAVVFPLLLLWSDWCRSERLDLPSLARLLRKDWPVYGLFFGLAACLALRAIGLAPFLQLFAAPVASVSTSVAAIPPAAAGAVENRSYANLMLFYGVKLLWPFQLVADYRGAFAFSLYPPSWGGWLSPLFALLCAAAAWLLHRWRPLAALGFGWILLALLPVGHLIPFHYPVAEHYLYLPAVGFALFLVGVGGGLPKPWPWLLGGALLLLFATATVARNRDWQDMESVTLDILRKLPQHQGARNTLVHLLIERRDWQGALREGETALRQDPGSPINHYNLAIVNEELGRIAAARYHYEQAIVLHPRLWDAYLNLGNLLLTHGEVAAGTAVLQRLTSLYGYHPLALWVLGNQKAREGAWGAAREHYRRQLALDRHDAAGYLGLAGAAWYLGDGDWRPELRRALEKGLRLDWAAQQQPWTSFFQLDEIRRFLAADNHSGEKR